MHHTNVGNSRQEFDPILATQVAQAAMMTLRPGAVSDDEPSNEHPRCEQWLFVLSGSGQAIIGKPHRGLRKVQLRKYSLLVIGKNEPHQIKNTGNTPLQTINFYVPPAYTESGEPKASAKK